VIFELVLALMIAFLAIAMPVPAKTGSTIYTPERVANARHNIERYKWASDIRDRTVANADHFANQPDDFLWELVTPQDIPRGIYVNTEIGCPKCGKAIDKFGNYPWKCDVFNIPWKITCPNCGEVFPKNDFGKFYESGKDSNGVFRYDKADRSLLYNTDHPDPNDPLHTYGVDDSMGWKDDKGNVYRFIGYYGHFGIWHAVHAALSNLRDAYIYTGDPRYARKAALMLYRIAEFYPEMNYDVWAERGFKNSDGGSGKGKIYGRIWETSLVDGFAFAYDAVYPALDDPQLLDYLSKKTGRQVTAADIRKLIEKNILHEIHDSILNRKIEGNEGMYQNTMTIAAITLDEPGTTDEWLDWVFANGDVRHNGKLGGNMVNIFNEKVDEDGMGDEASPSYNSIWRQLFRSINNYLNLYPRYNRHNIMGNSKFKKMFEAPVRLICIGKFAPHIGDDGNTGAPGLASISASDLIYAYRTFKDPEFARMAYMLNGNRADGFRGDIFDAEPEGIADKVEKIVKEQGPYVLKTDNMASYGCAILRSGQGDNQRALSLYYGRNMGHGHKDTLNIELFAYGLDLTPDLGYPEYAMSDCASRFEWTNNTISHNTVVVDKQKQSDSTLGTSHFVVEGNGASAAEVAADKPYPQASLYQRTVAMVDISDKNFYVVDIFRVKGGKEHLYSFHGAEGEVETEGLNLVSQPKGTLAGENIEPYADLGFKTGHYDNITGYQYLYDIRRDSHPADQPAITYNIVDTWHVLKQPEDIRLRVNLISPPGEVILAHGDPPRNKPGNPRRLQYILLPHESSKSTYVSVIEPYTGSRRISKIERKDEGDTVTLTITTTSGRVDTIVSALKPNKAGRFSVISQENGKSEVRLKIP